MKELNYEQLEPHLIQKHLLWEENDTIRMRHGRSCVSKAWRDLFGEDPPDKHTAMAKWRGVNCGCFIFDHGRVMVWSFAGSQIFQFPESVMQELGLYPLHFGPAAENPAPYPPHTQPAPPEGMKWEYRGKAWTNGMKPTTYYCVTGSPEDPKPSTYESIPVGLGQGHYFEAVPIPPEDSGFSIEKWAAEFDIPLNDPKGHAGSLKAPLHLVPSFPIHETSWVLKCGADKYGPYNFRENVIKASTYRSAMQRHLDQWFDGLEDADEETSRSHLAHVIASACIVMDAMKCGTLDDDRPRQKFAGTTSPTSSIPERS